MSMLPVPFKTFIPKIYWQDEKSDTLATEAEEHIEEWEQDVCQLEWLRQPERCPTGLLDELGYWLAAGINVQDTETEKRIKIATAVAAHKARGSFNFDAKPKVDAIAGGDSVIWSDVSEAWWVLTDGTSVLDWSAFGFDSSEGFDGIILAGTGDEVIFPGNIRIDVDNATLTSAQVASLVLTLQDVAPAYMRVILGYVSAGVFIEYANGRIE